MTAVGEYTKELREAADRRFAELGYPTTRDEEWRFTNVAPIARTQFVGAPPATADVDALVPYATGTRLVFINGHLVGQALGLSKDVEAGNLDKNANDHLAKHA